MHLIQSRIEEAVIWLEKSRSANPAAHRTFKPRLASAYALNGETERAAAELAEVRTAVRRRSLFDHRSADEPRGIWGAPKIRALFEATFVAGLRKAGMPEE